MSVLLTSLIWRLNSGVMNTLFIFWSLFASTIGMKNIILWIIILFSWEIFFGLLHAVFWSVCCSFCHQKLRHTVLNCLIGGSVELICIIWTFTIKATHYRVVGDGGFITKWTYFLAIFPFCGELIYNSIFMYRMSHANNIPFLGVIVIWCWWHFPPPCFCPQVLVFRCFARFSPHRSERKNVQILLETQKMYIYWLFRRVYNIYHRMFIDVKAKSTGWNVQLPNRDAVMWMIQQKALPLSSWDQVEKSKNFIPLELCDESHI